MVTPERPFRVQAWTDWSSDGVSYVDAFETAFEARAAAVRRPEPLVDITDLHEHRIIGVRRAVAFPGSESRFVPKDTLL